MIHTPYTEKLSLKNVPGISKKRENQKKNRKIHLNYVIAARLSSHSN